MLEIPYVGSDPLTMAITLDKNMAKRMASTRVAVPAGKVFSSVDQIDFSGLVFPLLVKPNTEGSSKGIRNFSRVDTIEKAREVIAWTINEYHGPALVEEFLPGAECTVGVIGNENPHVIGIMEIAPKNVPLDQFVYSLETKRDWKNQVEYHIPPRLPMTTLKEIETLAIEAFKALDCRDFSRVDIRLDGKGKPRFIEVNPLPGLSPYKSDIVILARGMGIEYPDLVGRILNAAFTRLHLI